RTVPAVNTHDNHMHGICTTETQSHYKCKKIEIKNDHGNTYTHATHPLPLVVKALRALSCSPYIYTDTNTPSLFMRISSRVTSEAAAKHHGVCTCLRHTLSASANQLQ